MFGEVEFKKYKIKGADYHYREIDKLNIKEFSAFVYARYLKYLDILKKHIEYSYDKNTPIKILDVGCGDGVLLYLIKKKFKNRNIELYGIDLSDAALKIAKKRIPDGKFINANLYNSKLEDNFFDIVISSDVIEHVRSPRKMLQEIKRVAKRNSFIVIGTPIKHTKIPLVKNHFQEFYQDDFMHLMCGYFNDCELIESHDLLYLLLYQRYIKVFNKRIPIFRYIINLLVIFLNINPFIKERKYKNQLFRCMYISCKK